MHRVILLLLVLAGCARDGVLATPFRDPAVPMFSSAAFDPARLPGEWVQAAAFAQPGAMPCRAGGGRIGPGLDAAMRLCLDDGEAPLSVRLRPAGPGRFAPDGARGPLAETWWVVWVDEGYRTLAIGTPSGAFGFVLNRGGPLPEDRLRAAAEIFDFNGYDTARLIRLR